jgi:hypothetical protein
MKKAFHKKLPGHKVESQRELTLAKVPDDRDSWTHGDGVETIHTLVECFNERKGQSHELYLGMDLRVFGDSARDIHGVMESLAAAKVKVYDLSHPDDDTDLKMFTRAQSAMRWNGDRGKQKIKGKKGGDAKKAAAEAKRNAIMSREAVIRMKAHPKLTLKDCAAILGLPFSVSTLRRNY